MRESVSQAMLFKCFTKCDKCLKYGCHGAISVKHDFIGKDSVKEIERKTGKFCNLVDMPI